MKNLESYDTGIKVHTISTIRYKVMATVGKVMIWVLEKLISWLTPNKLVFPNKDFPWIERLEKNHPQILEEFNRYYRETDEIPDIYAVSEEQQKLVEKKQWRFAPLFLFDNKIDFICAQLPFTTSLVEQIPGLTMVFFSVLNPHTKVAEHRGAFKGYLRYHMGIRIPDDYTSCGLKLDNEVLHWRNGQSMVFDDTYKHTAWNNSDEVRVVLCIDFVRPMPFGLEKITLFMTKLLSNSPYVRNALSQLLKYRNETKISELVG